MTRLEAALRPAADEARAAAMARYMRDLFPFLGLPAPARRALQRQALAPLPPPDEPSLAEAARLLWALPEREFQYAACDLLTRHVKRCGPGLLAAAEELITARSWWDTVDVLAVHVAGCLVRAHPALAAEMERWVAADDQWLARSAILHQVGWKAATNEERLFRFCLLRAPDRGFFIRKAIGWALRDYSWSNPAAVKAFVHAHSEELSPLSRSEALLAIEGRRKTKPAGV